MPGSRSRLLVGLLAAALSAACSGGGSTGGGGGGGTSNSAPPPTTAASSVTVAWEEASGPVEGYAIFVSRNDGPFRREQSVDQNQVTLTGAPGDKARLVVAAFDATGETGPGSPPSPPFTFPSSAAAQAKTASASAQSLPVPTGASAASAPESGPESGRASGGAVQTDASFEAPPDDTGESEGVGVEALVGALLWRADDALRVTDAELQTMLLTSVPPDAALIGVTDLDGDGAGDLLWSDGQLLSYTPLAHGAPTLGFGSLEPGETVAALGDFDGDGVGDLILRDGAGELAVWLTGADVPAHSLGVQGAARLAGVADFDGDGIDDVAWQDTDGALSLWLMDGVGSHARLEPDSDPGLEVSGAGDFDGNGSAELALRDGAGALFVHDPLVGSLEAVVAADPAQWTPVGSSDVDADGRDDLVLVGDGALLLVSLSGALEQPLDPASPWELVALLP